MRYAIIPNIITLLRFFLIIPIIWSLLTHCNKQAFFLFSFAGLTDAIDGYLARRFQWHSRWGSLADPIADKLLMISTCLTLAYLSVFPLLLLAVIILRDLIIVSGAACYHYLKGPYECKPSWLSKCNTFLQITLIMVLLFHHAFEILPAVLIQGLMAAVYFTSIASLLNYVFVWGRKALIN